MANIKRILFFLSLPILIPIFLFSLMLWTKKITALIFLVGMTICAFSMVYIISRK
jgi:hypothetical protein